MELIGLDAERTLRLKVLPVITKLFTHGRKMCVRAANQLCCMKHAQFAGNINSIQGR